MLILRYFGTFDFMESIGKRIATQRRLKNWKQEKLASELGVSQSVLSDIENDKISPKWEFIVSVAEKLETPIYTLLPQDTFNIMNNNNNHNVGYIQNNYAVTEEERTFYKETISNLQEQNAKLMILLDKLSDKLD